MTALEKLAFEQLREVVSKMNAATYDMYNGAEYDKDLDSLKERIKRQFAVYNKAYTRYCELTKALTEN